MGLPLDYVEFLLIAVAALAFLLLLFLLRRRQISQHSPLERALSHSRISMDPEKEDLFMSLLLLEDHYPVFGEILALVIVRCGIRKLFGRKDFIEPAQYLAQAAFAQEQSSVRGALCHIVRGFAQDPDIEYLCRPELSPLIDQFIEEVNQERQEG